MLERIIQQCEFKDTSPIELFCDEQINDEYFVRGRIFEFHERIRSPADKGIIVKVIYHFIILALVTTRYQKRIRRLDGGNCERFFFDGNTEKELPRYKTEHDKNLNCVVKLDEIEPFKRKYKKYLEKAIKERRDSILLGMEIQLKEICDQDRKLYPKSIFLLPAVHFSEKKDEICEIEDIVEFETKAFPRDLAFCLENYLEYDSNNYMDIETCERILQEIGDLGCEVKMRSRISKKFLGILERFKHSINDRADPLTDFVYSFYDDLEGYLRKKKNIRYCPLCRSYYRSKKESMYCEGCEQKGKTPEMNAYDEIQDTIKHYGISKDMPLEDVYHLFLNLSGKKGLIVALLRDKLVRENPEKNKSKIYEELADTLHISPSTVEHAKY